MLLGAWWEDYFARTITFAFVPFSLKLSSINPIVYTKTLLFIFVIPTFVLPSVRPFVDSLSVHHIILPFALISPSIVLLINSSAFDFALEPVSIVDRSISPVIAPLPVLEASFELSLVSIPLASYLCAIAFRLIVLPCTRINIAILFNKFSLTLCLWVDPIAFVVVARRMGKLTATVGLIVFPLPDVNSFIRPSLSTEPVSLIVGYFSMVGHSWLKLDDVYVSLTFYHCIFGQLSKGLVRFFGEVLIGCGILSFHINWQLITRFSLCILGQHEYLSSLTDVLADAMTIVSHWENKI